MPKENQTPSEKPALAAVSGASPGSELGASLEVRVNGKLVIHAYIRDEPKDDSEMIVFLKELVTMIEAPKIPDPDLDIPNDSDQKLAGDGAKPKEKNE